MQHEEKTTSVLLFRFQEVGVPTSWQCHQQRLQLIDRVDVRQPTQTFCEALHPATVAETLADEFTIEEIWRFLEPTNIRHQAAIFEYFPIEWQVKMVEGGGQQHMAKLIEQMSHDVVTFLTWAANPEMVQRKQMGWRWVLFFLLMAGLTYAVKRKVWADVH